MNEPEDVPTPLAGELARARDADLDRLLAEGEALLDPELARTARAALERMALERSPARRSRHLPVWLAAGAAAALLATLLVWTRESGVSKSAPPPRPLPLGVETLELGAPLGADSSYDVFRWSGEPPAGGWFEVRIWKEGSPGSLLRLIETETNEWRPTESERAALPDALRWEVRALDSSGNTSETAAGAARRRPSATRGAGSESSRDEAGSWEDEETVRGAIEEAYRLHEEGALEEAVELLTATVEGWPQARFGTVRALTVLASLLVPQGRFDESMQWLECAEGELARLSGPPDFLDVLRFGVVKTRIDTEIALGLVDRLHTQLLEEAELANRIEDERARTAVALHAIDHDLLRERYQRAVEGAERALSELDWAGRESEQALVQLRLGVARWLHSREEPRLVPAAETALRQALENPGIARPDRLQGYLRLAELQLVDERSAEARASLGSASELLAHLGPGSSASLDDALHLATLRLELALTGEAGGQEIRLLCNELEATFGRFLESWGSTPLRVGGISFLHYERRRLALGTLLHATTLVHPGEEGRRRAAELLFRTQSLGTSARQSGSSGRDAGTFEEVRRLLTERDSGLLLYVPGRFRSSVLAFSAEDSCQATLPPEQAFAPARRELQALIGASLGSESRLDPECERCLGELSRALLPGPIAARVAGWKHVTVVAWELLGYVPFELLSLEDGRRWEETTAISYLPSLPLGWLLHAPTTRARSFGHDLALLAATEPEEAQRARWPALTSIPLDENDAKTLNAGLAAERTRSWTGAQANLAALAECAATSRSLHLLAHGIVDRERERPFGLLLACGGPEDGDNGFLGSGEIERLRVPPLVRVSACGATQAAVRRGDDGVASLAGAFFAVGARVVLVSPQRIDLGSVLELTPPFHRALFERRRPPAEALRRARLELAGIERNPVRGMMHTLGLGWEPLPE